MNATYNTLSSERRSDVWNTILSNVEQTLTSLFEHRMNSNMLTDCPHVRQTKAKMAKSRNLVKPGWVHQLIGRIDHAKYF